MYVYEIVEWSEHHIAFPVKAIKGFALEYANSTRGQQEKREKGIKENSPPWISSLITVVIKERGGNCNKARDRMNRKGPSPSPFSLPLVPWPYLSVSLSPLQLWTEQSYSNGDRFLPLVFLLPFFSTFFSSFQDFPQSIDQQHVRSRPCGFIVLLKYNAPVILTYTLSVMLQWEFWILA